MINIENVEVVGWEHAIRGMRNPMNSWAKSDSGLVKIETMTAISPYRFRYHDKYTCYEIGPNDMSLMKRLCKAGTEHRKYLRMIVVYFDITAPLYW